MKLIPTAYDLIANMKVYFQPKNSKFSYLNEEPLRSELYSMDQMERFGKSLAQMHELCTKPTKEHLLKRLADNEIVLHKVRKLLADSIKEKLLITPAGEWLIDNFYLIAAQIRNAKNHFPKGYSEDLPQLANHASPGLTRIYDIVQQAIAHSDGRMDLSSLSSFIDAYQSITSLKLGELWAIPIMMRLALIENLRRVASRIAIDRVDENLANYWAAQLLERAENAPQDLILVVADMVRSQPPMVGAFVTELTRKLRGKGPDLALSLNWIEQQLIDTGMTSAELVNAEIQKQAADQVSISNSISSLKVLGAMDWRDFIETHSHVEQTLREDHEGVYGAMNFTTRDRYRHVVEQLSKQGGLPENDVARLAIALAKENIADPLQDARKSHVGYYLIGDGLRITQKRSQVDLFGISAIRQRIKPHRFLLYIATILLLTAGFTYGILISGFAQSDHLGLLITVGFLTALCTSQLAISLVNFLSTLIIKPNLLPRMDFSKQIPADCRSLVVVPVILSHVGKVDSLLEALEVRFLANRDPHLYFGLLTDFTDAAQATLPEDDEVLLQAEMGIVALNAKYKRPNNDLFYLFHRPRHWNPQENAWMGYERKRGKISELNALLRGEAKDRFSMIVGDVSIFQEIKYVITLDEDTQLPMGTAWKLIGTMAHPLNRAVYDAQKGRVTKGYGILQPRIAVSLPDITASRFAKMHGNEPGIDPYTRASSDVYQDLFEEGSFIGKGIYEVDIFKKVLEARFAENAILSHDLLEGCYLRSGLLSDVQLFEKYPNTYAADMKRRARWIRGDWQIFAWFLPFVPHLQHGWHRNPLSALSRWKIFDNIRRNLVPAGLTTLILMGWILYPLAFLWTLAISAIIVSPIILGSAWNILKKPKDVVLVHHVSNSLHHIAQVFTRSFFILICLPYEAYFGVKAILGTLWRMLVSRKKLLEWNPSVNDTSGNLWAAYREMWFELFLAAAVIVSIAIFAPTKLFVAGPILFLWLNAPFVTWWLSKPVARQVSQLTAQQHVFLRKMARKTWSFFEEFMQWEDNWLPPDNFQEQPVVMLAHRSSPTNIGLALLANVTAFDFGYIGIQQLLVRSANTLGTMQKMERSKGHFYNWYDTITLEPLLPKYISTVDSGNLVGHLLVLRQGLLSLPIQTHTSIKLIDGLQDSLRILEDTLPVEVRALLAPFDLALEQSKTQGWEGPLIWKQQLEDLSAAFVALKANFHQPLDNEAVRWLLAIDQQLAGALDALHIFRPWFMLAQAPTRWRDVLRQEVPTTLLGIFNAAHLLQTALLAPATEAIATEEGEWLASFRSALNSAQEQARQSILACEHLAQQCDAFADVQWDFLFEKSTNLLTIGYNVHDHKMDPSYYDLLASEVRLCNFVAIAQGKLPEESWFALGRLLTNVGGKPILLSWSGSMFEYLMPMLVMPNYQHTLLGQTCRTAVDWQIEYGKQLGLPWGVSESAYNLINADSHYQYHAFGAPGLGLKRGLEDDAVVAPYASALALMVAPEQACKNLEVLAAMGMEGRYGFYEAVDFTPSRLPLDETKAIIRSFMAHHQGMSLLALAYLLLDQPMQKRFEAEPQFQATLLLLQERVPRATTFIAHTTHIPEIEEKEFGTKTRTILSPNTTIPEVQLLSNGKYHVMVTNSGAGYSKWKDIAMTRWREDGTQDNWGTFCYIRDVEQGKFWSNTHQPSLAKASSYEVIYSQGRADFRAMHHEIDAHTTIAVSSEDDIEIRRIVLTNCSEVSRWLELTSYGEVVIAPAASDLMQPAFSNLFVQTEILPAHHAILCNRRPRSENEKSPWMFHLMTIWGNQPQEISYETDRLEFIGRGHTTVDPQVMQRNGPLLGHEGSVLDPIVAIRYKIKLEPEESATIDMIIGVSETKESSQNLIAKYQDKHHRDRVFGLAWTHSQVVLQHINATESEAQLFGRLAGSVLFANPVFRASPAVLISNQRGQSGLWGYSISGDLPIVLLKVNSQANIQLVRQLVQAHGYWRVKGLAVDLVIWNNEHNGYRQMFHNELLALIPAESHDTPGGIFVRNFDQISNEDRVLFETVARVVISDHDGSLAEYLGRKAFPKFVLPMIKPTTSIAPIISSLPPLEELQFFNGIGGFAADGREYVISLEPQSHTPAPWVNVIANPMFGTIISESGSGYTWSENAHELRLTPWHNDPVSNGGGEAFYFRDEDSGHFWSATSWPAGGHSSYRTRHGFGYSTFAHSEDGIDTEMTVFVDMESAVKFTVIKIRNESGRPRKLSATGYTEWVLGDNRAKTAMYIQTEIDPQSGAMLAQNPYNLAFAHRVAFFDVDGGRKTFTADRAEFLGRNGNLQNPAAMSRLKLSGKIGLALDPCAALQVTFELMDGESHEIVFRLGAGANARDASDLASRFRGSNAARVSLDRVKAYWAHTLSRLKVQTPDAATNIMTNGWLNYQTIASRMWGRSGYYQSGGAYGFRDQLQDVLSLLFTQPSLARAHILRSAARQFKEGDAQHWWHPPVGQGVRTRCSDDFLWLPYVTSAYIAHTGDAAILDESAFFLEGRPLDPEEESYYETPAASLQAASLYHHCVLAVKNAFRYGIHGLPLIGGGDWNDGFDQVGNEGKGESVWMGFFLYEVLTRFAKIAEQRADLDFAHQCLQEAKQLKANLAQHAWDGEWYRRAWFDDGSVLGAATNVECKIDSIAQSWSVLSGAGEPERMHIAMESAYQHLVHKDVGIVQLLEPPFDQGPLNPGYIKGYVPGVRENGGQYTHAAIWMIMAFAKLGDHARVWELLDMLNPINHGKGEDVMRRYMVEPYVLAADIYAKAPHAGRGGWTWYTGAAGWLYQLITTSFFGLAKGGKPTALCALRACRLEGV